MKTLNILLLIILIACNGAGGSGSPASSSIPVDPYDLFLAKPQQLFYLNVSSCASFTVNTNALMEKGWPEENVYNTNQAYASAPFETEVAISGREIEWTLNVINASCNVTMKIFIIDASGRVLLATKNAGTTGNTAILNY